jgi:hypothetical protein
MYLNGPNLQGCPPDDLSTTEVEPGGEHHCQPVSSYLATPLCQTGYTGQVPVVTGENVQTFSRRIVHNSQNFDITFSYVKFQHNGKPYFIGVGYEDPNGNFEPIQGQVNCLDDKCCEIKIQNITYHVILHKSTTSICN